MGYRVVGDLMASVEINFKKLRAVLCECKDSGIGYLVAVVEFQLYRLY